MLYVLKVLLVYVAILLGFRLIGTKAIAQLSNYDLAVLLVLSKVVTEPLLTKEVPVAIYGGFLLVGFYLLTAYGVLKSPLIQRAVLPKPIILVARGRMDQPALSKAKLSVQEFMTMTRHHGYTGPHEIEWAILEPDGHVSFIPKTAKRPIQPPDLYLQRPEPTLPLEVVVDGRLQCRVIERIGKTEDWLRGLLAGQRVVLQRVALALLDDKGTLWLYLARPTEFLWLSGMIQVEPKMFDVPFPDGS